MVQILRAVKQMSTKKIVHHDLKPANILLDKKHMLKITDFGLSVYEGTITEKRCGTHLYLPPELSSEQLRSTMKEVR